jgi:ribosomal protein S12 methylthiotransferase accessory factor
MELVKQNLLQFNPHFIIETVPPDEVFLLSEEEKKILRGPLFFSIAEVLKNGPRSEDHILEKLEEHVPMTDIYYALYQLKEKGYLVDALEDQGLASFCQYLNVPYSTAKKKLEDTYYEVRSLSQQSIDLETGLDALQIQRASSLHPANLTIILVDDYLDERIAPIIDALSEAKSLCILFKPIGKRSWMGPVFHSEVGPCFSCLKFWMGWNYLEETYIKERRGDKERIFASKALYTPILNLAISAFSLEIFKLIIGSQGSFLETGILTLDMAKNEYQKHYLNRWVMCPHCQKEEEKEISPPRLISRSKGRNKDGGHHTVSPEQTIRRYEHLVSPITGIIPSLEKISLGENLYAYTSSHHSFSMRGKLSKLGIEHFRQASGGKGKTEIQSKASALGEGLERHCGIFQGNEPRILASYEKIESEAIWPRDCSLFSDFQYKNRSQINAASHSFHIIPIPLDPKKKIEWSPLWSLTEGRWKYLPSSYCYYESRVGENGELEKECIADSNGCAAGNTLEEAILQGFYELVERDCVAIWWYNRIRMPAVDLQSWNDPYLNAVINQYANLGRELWVLDLTNDLGIATFVACSANKNGEKILFGFGTNLDPKIALHRAVSEMSQVMLLQRMIKKTVEKEKNMLDVFSEWLEKATLENQPHFSLSGKKRKLHDYPNRETPDLLGDIHLCQKIVQQEGMEILVLDQTRPEVGLPVVRVVVPGLRHFWPRFGPGRLYDVPVKMGWLEKANTEEELNPIDMMI